MVTRHDKYYFEDGNVVFQVGEKLFRIHKRLLVGSQWSLFADLFNPPQSRIFEGHTDERPIVLKGESPEEFEALMRILYPSLLENVCNIPIATYTKAMRIAVTYNMEDVQVAIVQVVAVQVEIARVIQKPPNGETIAQLAFIAEFQDHISKGVAIQVIADASSIDFHPTADDLKPLMAFPAFVAFLMQYREGLGNPGKAIWKETTNRTVHGKMGWLMTQFESLGFTWW